MVGLDFFPFLLKKVVKNIFYRRSSFSSLKWHGFFYSDMIKRNKTNIQRFHFLLYLEIQGNGYNIFQSYGKLHLFLTDEIPN